MRYLDEFQDPVLGRRLLAEIDAAATRPWALMEVCGGQTHSIIRHGIDQLLGDRIELIHGPGCPVCVTPLEMIERALEIARAPRRRVLFLRGHAPRAGRGRDLFAVKAAGADVRIVYSPLDAVAVAESEPDRQVVFFGVGFETTAPANAMAVFQARQRGLTNFSMLVSHVLVPPAIEAIVSAPRSRVDGFLAAGHVCSVMGTRQYEPLAERFHVPIVVTGFEPLDVLEGIRRCVLQLEAGRGEVENAYRRAVRPEGNPVAQAMLAEVFEVCDRSWRGIGTIPASGLRLTPEFAAFDAEQRFDVADVVVEEPAGCRAGEVLQGLLTPDRCEWFGTACTPDTPGGDHGVERGGMRRLLPVPAGGHPGDGRRD